MLISIVKGLYKRIENGQVLAERTAYFQLYLPQPESGQTQDLVTISRVKPNQLNIKPVEDKNGSSGQGYFCQGTSRFNFDLIDSAKLKDEAASYAKKENFAHNSVKWTIEDSLLKWFTPMKDSNKVVIKDCNHCYSVEVKNLSIAIAELKNFDNDIDLRAYVDTKVDKSEKSNTKRVTKKKLIG